jgi:hypothetical protein
MITDWRGFGKNRPWPNRGSIAASSLRDSVKPRKLSIRIAGYPTDARTEYLPSTSLKGYLQICLLVGKLLLPLLLLLVVVVVVVSPSIIIIIIIIIIICGLFNDAFNS